MTPEQIEKLRGFVEYYANCPCCDENEKCLEDCTFKSDEPGGYEIMKEARESLAGKP